MAYRDDVAALEMRRAGLERDLRELRASSEAAAASVAQCEAALAAVRAALDGARRPLPSLDEVNIASPCGVRWDAMAGDERVRFCGGCSKNVYNLSAMSRAEAEALVRANDDLCARFYRRDDGTLLTTDCPVGARRRRGRAAAVVALAGAAIATGVSVSAPSSSEVYFVPVGRLLGEAAHFEGRLVRLQGALVRGSIAKHDEPCEYRFRLAGGGVEVPVRYAQCVVPDDFREAPEHETDVVAEGRLGPDKAFVATHVLVRGGSTGYIMQRPDDAPAHEPGEPSGSSGPRDPREPRQLAASRGTLAAAGGGARPKPRPVIITNFRRTGQFPSCRGRAHF